MTAAAPAREAAARLGVAALLVLLAPVLLGVLLAAVAAGPAGHRRQIFRGLSRTLNGATDGDGDVTFSAQSAWNEQRGTRWGAARRRVVDALPFNGPGHCARALAWHQEHELIGPTEAED